MDDFARAKRVVDSLRSITAWMELVNRDALYGHKVLQDALQRMERNWREVSMEDLVQLEERVRKVSDAMRSFRDYAAANLRDQSEDA